MLNKLLGLFSYDIAIDLGTANTLIGIKDRGIIINEPSCIALNKNRSVLAVGNKSYEMVGKTPSGISTIFPLKDGVISDLDACEKMLKYFIQKAHSSESGFAKIPRPRAIISIPSKVTEVEERAVIRVAKDSGIREVYITSEPMSAAIGVGVDVSSPSGNMVIDVGGGTCDIAVISLGGIVVDQTKRLGGNKMNDAIINYCKDRFNVLIGDKQAEKIKSDFANVGIKDLNTEDVKEYYEASGRNLKTGLPEIIRLSHFDLHLALKELLDIIVDSAKLAIEDTPPELVSDLLKNGIYLVGGGSKLKGLDIVLHQALKIKIHIPQNAKTAVVDGNLKLLENKELLEMVRIRM